MCVVLNSKSMSIFELVANKLLKPNNSSYLKTLNIFTAIKYI